jgi:hypothetical protein
MRLRPPARIVPVVFSVAVTFLTVCGAGVAAANPTPASSAPVGGSVLWAYGAVATAHAHRQGLLLGWEASATAGFAVVLGETVGTAGTYTVYVNRTMGLLVSAHYCRPDCARPLRSGTVSFHAWETTLATLELTSHANVSVSGTPTLALGLLSSSLTVQVGLAEGSQVFNASLLGGSWNLTAFLNGTSRTTFSPALGLMPLDIVPSSWTNSSAFHESGNANWSIAVKSSGLLSSTNGKVHGEVPFSRSGTVRLNGSFNGSTVGLGGASYDVLNLSLSGPFTLRDGFLLVPQATDLFGASSPNWLAGNTTVTAAAATVSGARADVGSSLVAGSHLGIAASRLRLTSQTTNPVTSTSVGGAGGLALYTGSGSAAPASAPGSNATFLQGSPESVGQATTDQHCLTTGLGCPGIGSARLPFGLLAVGAAAVVAALLVAVVAERRRLPVAPHPNAKLYPPGGSANAGPTLVRRPVGGSPPDGDDPLGHLW